MEKFQKHGVDLFVPEIEVEQATRGDFERGDGGVDDVHCGVHGGVKGPVSEVKERDDGVDFSLVLKWEVSMIVLKVWRI